LLRFADIDANNADHGDYLNEFDYGSESAWGYNTDAYGVAVSAAPTKVSHQGIVWDVSGGPDPCASTHLAAGCELALSSDRGASSHGCIWGMYGRSQRRWATNRGQSQSILLFFSFS